MKKYRVIDLRSGVIEQAQIVDADTPEDAAFQTLGEKLVRAGQRRNGLICRVYWHDTGGKTNMVRLYRPVQKEAEPSLS